MSHDWCVTLAVAGGLAAGALAGLALYGLLLRRVAARVREALREGDALTHKMRRRAVAHGLEVAADPRRLARLVGELEEGRDA